MDLEYKKYINTYDPVAVGWTHNKNSILIEFSEPISAIYSEKLDRVVVEIYAENKLSFYQLSGQLDFSIDLPNLECYQFRGIHKNFESKTGISFLFHPVADSVGNKWRDTEQYELDVKTSNFLGRRLGIYR